MKNIIKKILREYIVEQKKFWSYDEVKDEALKYDNLKDFREKSNSAFQWAKRNKLIPELTSHMIRQHISKTKSEIYDLVKNYTTQKDFIKDHPNEYNQAKRKGWTDIFDHLKKSKESWTLDKVLDLARKVSNMEEFRNTYPNAYDISRRYEGWKEEVWKLYEPQQTKWTYELAKSIADQYDDLTDFSKSEPKAHAAIRRLGWLDLLDHLKKDKRTWTDDEIRQEASKYKTISDFRNYARNAMDAAINHGIYDEVTKHMERAYTEWTKDMVWKEALNYKTRSEFQDNNGAAYQAAQKNGWIDDVTSHMERLGNLYKRIVYVYEFPDNSVYVGLTLNKTDRDMRHKQKPKSAVYQHIKKTNLIPTLKYISDDYIDAEDARNQERCTIEEYKSKGWNVLNKAKAGGLGGCAKKWSKDEILRMAKEFDSPSKFKDRRSSAYNAAKRNGWLDEVTKHMVNKKIKWTDDMIMSQLSNYDSVGDLRNSNPKLFAVAFRRLGNDFLKKYYNDIHNNPVFQTVK
jgi:predicted GIY-YIG superfamily endonuclease